MEDDDEIHSHPSPFSNDRISVTASVASPSSSTPPPPPLGFPIQQQQKTPGGREDCWSEGATAVLIDAWGERYMELSRGNLKQKHWKEVADIVRGREDYYTKTPKTDVQCKNRIDTVKKKYKAEKAKIAAGGGPSNWLFYDKLDELIGSTLKINNSGASPVDVVTNNMHWRMLHGIPLGVRLASVSNQQLQQKPNLRACKRPKVEYSDNEPENSAESSDGLPPMSYKRVHKEKMTVNNKATFRQGMTNKKRDDAGSRCGDKEIRWGDAMRELTHSISKLGEAYEQGETMKLQQLVEMEKERMKFAKELELQRMQYFMKMQVELSQLKLRRPGNDNRHRSSNNNGNANVNNSDSSN